MSTAINAGWLKDEEGIKFAPKTMSSQIINDDGTLFKDNIELEIAETKTYIDNAISAKADSDHTHSIMDVTNLQSTLDGKADKSHGNHVPTTQSADDATFLRNDNTWQKVTPTNIGAAPSTHNHTISQITDLTATATELNYIGGVTSNVQTQLDAKAPAIGVAYIDENDNETIVLGDLTEIANLIGGDA